MTHSSESEGEDQSDCDQKRLQSSKQSNLCFLIKHRVLERDTRRCLIEFGRFFISGSIAGLSLRNESAGPTAEKLSAAFLQFSVCIHSFDVACVDFAIELKRIAKLTEEEIASASRLAQSPSESTIMDSSPPNRELVKVSHHILNVAVPVRVEYSSQVYHERLANGINDYKTSHTAATKEFGNETTNDWFAIASKTGEFFPEEMY